MTPPLNGYHFSYPLFESDDGDRSLDLMDDVRAFHGTDGSEVPAPAACAAEAPGSEAPSASEADAATGCATVPSAAALPALGLVIAAALGRRRFVTREKARYQRG